jgi:hypothetical protein
VRSPPPTITGNVGTIGETKPLNAQEQEVVLLVIAFVYYFSETTSTNHYWICRKPRGDQNTGCNMYNNR